MQVGIDPKVDYAFKRLFGVEQNHDLLIDLLNAVLEPAEGERITAVQLLNPFSTKESWDDKLSIVDIKARDQADRLFHIEMQMVANRFLPERLLYYWSRLLQQQLKAGDEYGLLRPTITICFLDDHLFDEPDWRWRFELRDAARQTRLTDLLAIHLFELPKFERPVAELASELERWLYFLRYGARLDPAELPVTLQVRPISRALEELKMLTQDELEHEQYEARLRNALDERSKIKYHERALSEGIQKSRAEERTAALVDKIRLLQQILKVPPTPADDLRPRPEAELLQLYTDLERQALSR